MIKYTFEHYQEQIFLASLASSEHCKEAEGRTRVSEAVTVLIVEDDQLIQGMVEEALSDGGFKSVITGSGEEAVALLQANESVYRAIVTDINLLGTIDGWEVARLLCPYCGCRDHTRLGFLHVEGEDMKWRAATCDDCHGYVKMVSTLSALPPLAVLVADVATLHLDLMASERGYTNAPG